MEMGIVGLGKMGANMTRRLLQGKHQIVAYDPNQAAVQAVVQDGATGAASLETFVKSLKAPRTVWLMIPAGGPVDDCVKALGGLLSKGDLVIDGGNSYYKDDIRHAAELGKLGIKYMDAGVSGGIWGLEIGFCLMVGGDEGEFRRVEPLLKTLAPKEGYLYCGAVGSGHFVKMVHNGIEYGMMQAYAEGFEIIERSPYKQDMAKLSHLWNQGSVVRSWLLELAENAFTQDHDLTGIEGFVEDSGEGRWTVHQAVDTGVAAPVITLSLYNRFLSRTKNTFSNRVLAALRHQFGGHAVVKVK
jgi:6-phosphogluconate dehydrogenase